MNDLIERQLAIDTIMGQPPEPHYPSWYAAQVEKLPAVQPEPHWIPCSERMSEDGRYLVTRFDFVTNTCFLDIMWYEKGVWWNRLYTGDFAVIAWMPLPEPYRGNM